jgi:phosphatidylserine/phosphatidylglycerophosphate/cardiolipin synthase-like enzyme
VIVPRHSDHSGRVKTPPAHFGRQEALRLCGRAGGDRFQVYDLENDAGTPVYVHAKVVVIDDVWAMIGSDNLNRRSWTHDSELSIAVLDRMPDKRPPLDPAELGDCARVFARDLRLRLMTEHLGRKNDDVDDLIDPDDAAAAVAASAAELQTWYAGGRQGARPSGRLLPHEPPGLSRLDRAWARPVYKALYDPDGSAWRDRLRRRG